MPSFYVQTFGCQMNAHDSSRMEEVLMAAGYRKTDSAGAADLVILNTCSIREKAEQKLRSEVGRLGQLKKRRPDLVIGVAGCVAQQEGERLMKGLPQIDLIIGPDNIPELPALVAEIETGGLPQVRTVFDTDAPSFLAAQPRPGQAGATAYVTIMKGCNERCSYCIVPTTRGPERYRASREIIEEVERFVEAGVVEVTLLGQTVNSYLDPSGELPSLPEAGPCRWKHTRGARAAQDETQFPALLRAIAERVPGLQRLRYTSPHPRHLTSSLILAHQELPILTHHVHMPVQSGSDAQLRKMIRRYTAEEYVERTDALKEAVPGLTLSTDMIVGFPGETEDDFRATLELVRRVGFVALYGFTYSQRPFTPALNLHDDVSSEVKSERLQRLFELVDTQKAVHLGGLKGSRQSVLIEGWNKTGGLTGRTFRNEIVHLSSDASTGPGVGAIVEVEIERIFKNSVEGRLLQVERAAPAVSRAQGQPSEAQSPFQARTPLASSTGSRRSLAVLP